MFVFTAAADLHYEAGLLDNLLDNVTPTFYGLKEPGPDNFSPDLLASDQPNQNLTQNIYLNI